MKPVLLVSFAPVLGGAERILLDWAAALDSPVVLACPPGPLAAASGFEHAPLAERPLARRGRSAAAARDLAALAADLRRLTRSIRPRAVVASGQRPLLAAAAAPLSGAPLVALLQDLPPKPAARASPRSGMRPAPLGDGRAVAAIALRAAARRADAIVALSGAISRAHDPGGRRLGRTHVIHPGVDAAHWALPDAPGKPPRALLLGALVPWKRADLALEIAARLPDLRLDIAGAPLPGDPPQFAAAIAERAAAPGLAGRVRLVGALPDPRTALRDAHVLLHCADEEPYGLALVEALAAGRPVVAPAAGGPLEIVTPSAGKLYAPGDATAGAAALAAALAEPALCAGARARAATFDRDAAARRFAAVVARVAR
jgi:glycosyltransferase involved in cell wall biosynthesis